MFLKSALGIEVKTLTDHVITVFSWGKKLIFGLDSTGKCLFYISLEYSMKASKFWQSGA